MEWRTLTTQGLRKHRLRVPRGLCAKQIITLRMSPRLGDYRLGVGNQGFFFYLGDDVTSISYGGGHQLASLSSGVARNL